MKRETVAQGKPTVFQDSSVNCVFPSREQNRSAVGKTETSFTSRRPRQLVPSTRASLVACTAAPCYAPAWSSSAAASALFFTSRASGTLPRTRPLPIYSIYIKAKAVPIAASSSAFASARPTRLESRPSLLTALRIQDSAEGAPLNRRSPPTVGFCPFACDTRVSREVCCSSRRR
jgi:hypothetical protein